MSHPPPGHSGTSYAARRHAVSILTTVVAFGAAWPALYAGCSSSSAGARPDGGLIDATFDAGSSPADAALDVLGSDSSSSPGDANVAEAAADASESGPTPPPEAKAAGFLTLAANYDFSTPFYANTANWLDCDNTNPNVPWHKGAVGSLSPVPCNESVGADPQYGGQVLDMKWLNSYGSISGAGGSGGNDAFVSMMTAMKGANGTSYWPGPVTASFPNMYVESTYRSDNVAVSYQNDGPSGVWTWQETGGDGGGWSPIELDLGELYNGFSGTPKGFADGATHQWWNSSKGYSNQGGADWTTWQSTTNGKVPAGYSIDTYHKYGALLTSDGATSIYECHFIDDVLQNCFNVTSFMDPSGYAARTFLLVWIGAYPVTGADGGLQFGENKNLYVKYIRVWSCASWANSECNGTALVDSGGLTYWH
jgi:hypothetical protein